MSALATAPVTTPDDEPRQSGTQTALRLGSLALGTGLFVAGILALGGWPWVVVIFAVIGIVMLHEAGHYVTAKLSGMKATEFFVGFGPRLWSITRGETEYGVKALPLGGYVRILGMTSVEEVDPSDEPRSFINQSTSKRVLVASAGSIVHLLLAVGLAIGALWFIGEPQPQQVVITSLVTSAGASTPAELAGLHSGDEVLSINGTKMTWDNIFSTIQSAAGTPLHIVVLRHGTRVELTAVPTSRTTAGVTTGYLGVYLNALPAVFTHPGVTGSVTGGVALIGHVITGTFGAFGSSFSPSGLTSLAHQVTSPKAAAQARASGTTTYSIIGALELFADSVRANPLDAIQILIALNISLGILNMLPMLPLDGGHVAISLYERVRTRRGSAGYHADVRKLLPVVYAFMGLLLVFVASKMYLDLAHGVANPFG